MKRNERKNKQINNISWFALKKRKMLIKTIKIFGLDMKCQIKMNNLLISNTEKACKITIKWSK